MDFFNWFQNNKNIMLIVSVVINISLALVTGYLAITRQTEVTSDSNVLLTEEKVTEEVPGNYYVEVKGAVLNPGVYEVQSNAIIRDVILLAGDFTTDAYTDNINLSKKVSNELVIYVFTKEAYQEKTTSPVEEVVCNCPSYDISSCVENHNSVITSENSSSSVSNNSSSEKETEIINSKVNINTASLEELMTLTGIGEAKAKDIINYRNTNGNFQSIEDIKKVNGIKDATYNKIKDNITI